MSAHLGDAISALLDGELLDDEQLTTLAHLDTCEVCAGEYESIRAVRAALRALPMVDPPAGFIDGLLLAGAVPVADDPAVDGLAVDGLAVGERPVGERPVGDRPVDELAAARTRRRPPVWLAGVAAAAALVFLAVAPHHQPAVRPPVSTFVDAHATSSPGPDPVSGLAPVAIPVSFQP